jgi:hypothetical protein
METSEQHVCYQCPSISLGLGPIDNIPWEAQGTEIWSALTCVLVVRTNNEAAQTRVSISALAKGLRILTRLLPNRWNRKREAPWTGTSGLATRRIFPFLIPTSLQTELRRAWRAPGSVTSRGNSKDANLRREVPTRCRIALCAEKLRTLQTQGAMEIDDAEAKIIVC